MILICYDYSLNMVLICCECIQDEYFIFKTYFFHTQGLARIQILNHMVKEHKPLLLVLIIVGKKVNKCFFYKYLCVQES